MHPVDNHRTTLRDRFSSAADTYGRAASVQRKVADRLADGMGNRAAHVLEVGCGSGHLTHRLLDAMPSARLDIMDISADMVTVARADAPPHPSVRWISGDVLHLQPERPYDLIVSASALQWVHPVGTCYRKLFGLLAPGGRLACAVMVEGTLAELHASRLRVAPDNPPQGTLPGSTEVLQAVGRAGFEAIESFAESHVATYPTARDFLAVLRRTGVTGGRVSRGRAPLGRNQLRDLMDDYERNYLDGGGGVRATYRVLYLNASRPAS